MKHACKLFMEYIFFNIQIQRNGGRLTKAFINLFLLLRKRTHACRFTKLYYLCAGNTGKLSPVI
jgi:hypothetical protein